MDQYSVGNISKATKILYYKINRMLTWKRKNPFSIMYTWKLPQSVKEEVADFYQSSIISYRLPDMRYISNRFMRMSLDEAYDIYKMNISNEMHCVGRSIFSKFWLKNVITVGNAPVHQWCCHTCQNFRLILLSMIRSGLKVSTGMQERQSKEASVG